MLRQIDRVLAPLTWIAAAFTVLVLLAGPSLIGADKAGAPADAKAAAPDGKALFVSNCGGCHTLSRAGTSGSTGPNLDDAKPEQATVKAVATGGKGSMPAFEGSLSGAEIDAVAAFVAGVEPTPAPTPAATEAAQADEDVTFVSTGRGPDGVTLAGDDVWVAHATAGTLQRFDASNNLVGDKPLRVGRQPDNPAVAGDEVWVALSGDDAVARVADGEITRFPVGDAPEDLVIVGDTVWVANAGDDTVSRIDRATGQPAGAPIGVGGAPLGIASGGGSIWVSSNADGTVWRLDAGTGAVQGEPISVGDRPRAVDYGASSAWVANAGDDTVTRVRDRRAVEVGDNPRDLVFDRGAVWVANAGDDTVVRIDARSAEVDADPVKVGDDPIGIAVGKKAVWATGFRDDTLSRIPAGG